MNGQRERCSGPLAAQHAKPDWQWHVRREIGEEAAETPQSGACVERGRRAGHHRHMMAGMGYGLCLQLREAIPRSEIGFDHDLQPIRLRRLGGVIAGLRIREVTVPPEDELAKRIGRAVMRPQVHDQP